MGRHLEGVVGDVEGDSNWQQLEILGCENELRNLGHI